MKKLYLFIILFAGLSNYLYAQENAPVEIGKFFANLLGEKPAGLGGAGTYVILEGGGLTNYVAFDAEPGFISYVKHNGNDLSETGIDHIPDGYSIFLDGTKYKKLGPPYLGVYQYAALAASNEGTDTILIIVDPRNPSVVQVNPYDFKSTCTGGTGSQCIETFHKLEGDGIYVLGQYIFGTHNNGKTWFVDSVGLGTATYTVNDMAMDTSLLYLYAATTKGVYKQDTVNDVWAPVNNYPGGATHNATAIFIDRKNRILVGDNAGLNNQICNISTDGGLTWQTDTTGLNFDGQTSIIGFAGDVYGNLYAITQIGFEFATATYHVYRSPHGTGPWQLADSSLYNKIGGYPFSINKLSASDILFLTTSVGKFISTDSGTTWHSDNTGLPTNSFSGFAKTKTGRYLAGNILGLHYLNAGDSVWHKTYPVNGYLTKPPLFQDSVGNLYTLDPYINQSYTTYPVIKSPDNGNTWQLDTAGLYNVPNCAGNFFVDETGGQHFFSSSQAFVESKSNGGTWKVDTSGFNNASSIFALGTDGRGYIYATGRAGGGAIKRRPVAGGTWALDTAGIPSSYSYFPRMASSGKHVFVYTNINYSGKLFRRSADKWHSIPLPPSNTFYSLYVAAVSQDKSGYIYAAFYLNKYSSYAPFGVYYTRDTGQTWTLAGLDSVGTNGLFGQGIKALVSYGDTTYAITEHDGIYAFTHQSALPVTLSSVRAYPLDKGIQIEWSDYNEINMSGYEVEKSANGNQFIKIGSIPAKGINNSENKYSLFDASPFNGDNFYRIKANNKDGGAQYSGVVKVNITSNKTGIEVFPNPAVNKMINVQLNNVEAGKYTLSVYSAAGQLLYARSISHPGGNAAISINIQNITKGIYWVTLKGTKHIYNKTVAAQ